MTPTDPLPDQRQEPGLDPAPESWDTKALRRFVLAFAATVTLLLGALGGFNALQDPYRILGTPQLRGISDVQPRPLAYYTRRGTLRFLEGLGRRSTAPEVLVGTSHVRDGITTCGSPEVLRLAARGITATESAYLLGGILPPQGPPRTVFMEVVGAGALRSEANLTPASLFQALFGLEATEVSLRTLVASRRMAASPDPQDRGCMVPPWDEPEPRPWQDLTGRARELVPRLSLQDAEALRATVHGFLRRCAPAGHRLRLFLAPLSPELLAVPGVREAVSANAVAVEALLDASRGGSACDLSFVDLSEALDREPAGAWYDPTHFRPEAGKVLLARLRAF